MSELSILRVIFIIYLLISRINIFGINIHSFSVTIPTSIFALITIILYIKKYYKNPKRLLNKYVIIPFFFILICIISSFLNLRRIPFYNIVNNIIIFYMLFKIDESDINKEKNIIAIILCHSISIVSVLTVIFLILEKFGIIIFNTSSFFQYSRLVGVIRYYDTPNGVAITSFIGIVFSLLNYHKNKILYSIYILSGITVILLTDSRSTILALILSLSIIAILKFKNIKSYRLNINNTHVALAFLIAISILIYFLNGERIKVNNDIYEGSTLVFFLNKITNYRFSMYKEALILGLKSPIIGNGLNSFVHNSKIYFGENSYAAIFTGENPHNIFIALFYYTGFIGLFLISYLFFDVIKKSIILLKSEFNINNICYFMVVIGIILYSSLDVNVLFHIQLSGYVFWIVSGYIFNIFN